jgi:hypothetical protein
VILPFIPKRPPSLAHLSDEAAARALSRRYGDIVAAARDLGIDRKDLRRLVWHNTEILAAAHERIDLFVIAMQGELVSEVMSGSAGVRQRAIDRMFEISAVPGHPVGRAFVGLSSLGLLARAPRVRSVDAEAAEKAEQVRFLLEQEAVAELARERDAEFEGDRRRELERERAREAEVEASPRREWERERAAALRPVPSGRRPELAAQGGSLWPANIRRPTRGRR